MTDEYIHVIYHTVTKLRVGIFTEVFTQSVVTLFPLDHGSVGTEDKILDEVAESLTNPSWDEEGKEYTWADGLATTRLRGWMLISPATYELLKEYGVGDYSVV